MSRRPWFRWYPGDYLADTYELSWDEDLLYRRILDALWKHETVPASPRDLAKVVRTDPRKCARLLPNVLPYLTETSGRLHHPKMTAQRLEAIDRTEKARAAGRKGGQANAQATRAGARVGARARPDPDPDKDLRVTGSPLNSNPDGASDSALSPEDRAQAEAIDADLAQRRAALGVVDGGAALRPVGEIAGQLANPKTREGET